MTPNVFPNHISSNQNGSSIFRSTRVKKRLSPISMNDLMSGSAEADEFVHACMSLNGVCLSTLPEYYGDLTSISREMKMARRFRWISRCGGRNREATVPLRNSHAVRIPCVSSFDMLTG